MSNIVLLYQIDVSADGNARFAQARIFRNPPEEGTVRWRLKLELPVGSEVGATAEIGLETGP